MTRTATAAASRPAAIYVRISDDRDGDELGVQRQLKVCRQIAKDAGYRVIEEYVENDVSAWSGRRRGEFERMIDDLQADRFEVVVAWAQDRIGRRLRDLVRIADVIEAKRGLLHLRSEGVIDPATYDGALRLQIFATIGEAESRRKAERNRAKHRELAERGLPSGGGERPFGFEADRITHREDEAEILRESIDHVLAGGTLRSLVADLNARGVTTTRGGRLVATNFKRALTNPRIAGLREHSGEYFEAVWKPIVSREKWERARAILLDPSRRSSDRGGAPRKYLLAGGLVVCGRCGKRLVSASKGFGYRYVCSTEATGGCGRLSINGAPLDELVQADVLEALTDEKKLAKMRRAWNSEDRSVAKAAKELTEATAKREEIAAAVVDGKLSIALASAAEKKLDGRIEELQRTLAGTAEVRTLAALPTTYDGLLAAWNERSLEGRRQIVAAVLEPIVVEPAEGRRIPLDERVTIRLRAI